MRIFILLFLGLLSLTACGYKFKEYTYKDRNYSDFVLNEFSYISVDENGKKDWELIASQSKMYAGKNTIYVKNMTIAFFNKEGKTRSFLSSNSGFFNRDNMSIIAEGSVKIISDNNVSIDANTIYWDNDNEKFYTKKGERVLLVRNNTKLYCYNLIADANLDEVEYEYSEAYIE